MNNIELNLVYNFMAPVSPVVAMADKLQSKYASQLGHAMRENSRRTRDYFCDGRSDDYGDGPELIEEDSILLALRVIERCHEMAKVNRKIPMFTYRTIEEILSNF